MYCSSCGNSVAHGLSYCNYCGAKLPGEQVDKVIKSSDVRPESLVWGMVAVLIFGFVAVVFLMMAMKMVGLSVGQILSFMTVSFLLMLMLEGAFIWKLLSRKRGGEETGETTLAKEQATKELAGAKARMLRESMPSVTEHTT